MSLGKWAVLVVFGILSAVAAQAHPAWGIAVDRSGNIYFADIGREGRGAVWRVDNNGRLQALLTDFHAHSVNVDDAGNVFAAHGEGRHLLLQLGQDGKVDTIAEAGDYREFNGGNCCVRGDGTVFFYAAHHVWRLDGSGVRQMFNSYYSGWTQTLYATGNGDVLIPDIGDSSGRVIRLRPDGSHVQVAEGLISTRGTPDYNRHGDVLFGISEDTKGNIYVCEAAGRRIVRITPDGGQSDFYSSEAGRLPTGLTFSDGSAFILEYGVRAETGPQIVRIAADGEKTILFNYDNYQDEIQYGPHARQR